VPSFIMRAFRGADRLPGPVYDRREAASLAEAQRVAAEMYEDRAVSIYEVIGGRWQFVENYEPDLRCRVGKSRDLWCSG